MRRFLVLMLLVATPALADPGCEACRSADEMQAGDYVAPEVPLPTVTNPSDPRGKAIDLPLPGAPTVHHRPGLGLWVGSAGEGNNVFVDAKQSKATVGLHRDF